MLRRCCKPTWIRLTSPELQKLSQCSADSLLHVAHLVKRYPMYFHPTVVKGTRLRLKAVDGCHQLVTNGKVESCRQSIEDDDDERHTTLGTQSFLERAPEQTIDLTNGSYGFPHARLATSPTWYGSIDFATWQPETWMANDTSTDFDSFLLSDTNVLEHDKAV